MTKHSRFRSFLSALSVVTVLAVGAPALAQRGGHHGGDRAGRLHAPDPERMAARMEERLTAMRAPLSLSEAQVAQIRAIFQEGLAQVRAELATHPEPGEARREALRRIHFTMDDRVHSLLSCEQREALRQFRREHRAEHRAERLEHRRERRGGRGGGAGAGVDRGI